MKMIVFANPMFAESLQKLMELDMPVKAAYRLSKIHKNILTESEKFDEMRKGIVQKYAKKKDDGEMDVDESGNVSIPNETIEDLNKELNELFDIDFEIDTMSIADLGNASVTPKMIALLNEILVD